MTITILGAGYVGLTSAAVFAELGNTVYAVRKDKEKVEELKKGKIPFFEPELEEIVARNVKQGRLIPTIDYSISVPHSDIVFICVGTPTGKNGEADLSQVVAATEELAKYLKQGYTVIVDKSTVPIGTADKVMDIIQKHVQKGAQFDVVSSPEFLRQGNAVWDTFNPDRIVIGAASKRAADLLLELHKPLPGERVVTDVKTAEMIKYASNSLLATEISFINSIARLCEKLGADVKEVSRGMRLDKRIGKNAFLDAGVGYGGSCFPKDVKALVEIAKQVGERFTILEEVEHINQEQRQRFVKKIQEALGKNDLRGKIIGVWGLAFKARTDDLREAPSLTVIQELQAAGATIRAYDPVASEGAKKILHDVVFTSSSIEAAHGTDVLCILTDWDEFKEVDLDRIKKSMRKPIIVDGRNLYDLVIMRKKKIHYISIGRA